MFLYCKTLNVSKCTLGSVFIGKNFKQYISKWNISHILIDSVRNMASVNFQLVFLKVNSVRNRYIVDVMQ